MNKHEVELISALAEGALEDETEARLLIASSPELRAEYETQKTAIAALRQVPTASLTEHERSELRRGVWTQLRAQPAEGRVSTPWYYRWSTAAAGLVLVVGLVAVLNQSDSPVAESLAADGVSAELSAETGVVTTSLAGEEAADGAAAPLARESAAADVDSGISEEVTGFLAEVAARTRLGSAESLTYSATQAPAKQSLELCVAAAGLEDHEVIGQLEFSPETTYIVTAPSEVDLESDTPISFVDAETCELIYTDG